MFEFRYLYSLYMSCMLPRQLRWLDKLLLRSINEQVSRVSLLKTAGRASDVHIKWQAKAFPLPQQMDGSMELIRQSSNCRSVANMIPSTYKEEKASYQHCTETGMKIIRSSLSRNEWSMRRVISRHQSLPFGYMTSRVLQRNEMADRSATFRDCVQAMALSEQIC